MDYQSLSHSKWECKYHVVFIPKYRKKKLYGSIRTDLGEKLYRLAEHKDISYRRWDLMRMSYGITSETKKKIADKMGNNS